MQDYAIMVVIYGNLETKITKLRHFIGRRLLPLFVLSTSLLSTLIRGNI